MDWMTQLKVMQIWHVQSQAKQRALVKSYLITHPGISTTDDWLRFLAAVFGIGRPNPGYLDLDGLAPRQRCHADGGTRVPFVVRWPGRIEPGVSAATVSQIDLIASLAKLLAKIDRMQVVLSQSRADAALETRLHEVRESIFTVDEALNGNRSRQEPGEKTRPIIQNRLFA